MKKIFVGMAASLLALSASPSVAATYNLGTLTPGVPASQTGTLTGANPSDTINFSLPSVLDLTGQVDNIKVAFGPFTFFNFSALQADIFSGATPLGTLVAGSSLTLPALGAGPFTAVVTGTPTGLSGGLYSLTLFANQNAAPAPGPAGLLVFGAGLGAMWMKRRKAARA
jgi:hypothetical protein